MSAHRKTTVAVASIVFLAACGLTISTVPAVGRTVLGRMGYSAADTRLVTGFIVTGTAQRPRLYVASSDPRVGGAASNGSPPGDTNSGVISQVDWTGTRWERRDIVRGLPRSRSNHATNGLALSAGAKTLYVAQGSNTNKGAPSEEFGGLAEYALSGAILAVDLERIDGSYDIPTLQRRGPFGGRGGRNQARLVPGGPVAVFAPGFRNPYDVVVTQSGRIYTVQNGANPGWGDSPAGEGRRGSCTNEPRAGGTRDVDTLQLVEEGAYGGHPNPTRGNRANTFGTEGSPVAAANPVECEYVPPYERAALATFDASTNGLAEYGASNAGGSMLGDLLATSLDGRVHRLELDARGERIVSRQTLAVLGSPLDVTAQGDEALFPGTIWIAQYTTGRYEERFDQRAGAITVLEPTDFERAQDWLRLPSTGLRRQEVSLVETGGRLYLAGGDRRQQRYDPAAHRWADVAPLPRRLDHIQGVAIGSRIYYLGGLAGWPGPAVGTVNVYEPRTDTFTSGRPMNRPRGAGGVVVAAGRIYYLGGLHEGRAVPWVDVYDPRGDRWSQLPDMPRPRDHFQAVALGGKIYAIGGRDSEIGRETAATDALDLLTGRWVTGLAPIPTPRGGYAAAAIDGEIIVVGGEATTGALATVEAYETDGDAWRRLPPMPTPRHGIQAALCRGAVYIAGGGLVAGGNAPTDVFEAYVPPGVEGCDPTSSQDDEATGERAPTFAQGRVDGIDVSRATALQFGPDGRLYVAQQDGLIHVYGIVRRGRLRYEVVSNERIDVIQEIPNHDDDGSSAVGGRAVLRVVRDKLGL